MKQWLSNSLDYTTSSWVCIFVACARLTLHIKNAMSVLPPVRNMNFSLADAVFSRMEQMQLPLSSSSWEKSFAVFVTGVSGLFLHARARTRQLLFPHFL